MLVKVFVLMALLVLSSHAKFWFKKSRATKADQGRFVCNYESYTESKDIIDFLEYTNKCLGYMRQLKWYKTLSTRTMRGILLGYSEHCRMAQTMSPDIRTNATILLHAPSAIPYVQKAKKRLQRVKRRMGRMVRVHNKLSRKKNSIGLPSLDGRPLDREMTVTPSQRLKEDEPPFEGLMRIHRDCVSFLRDTGELDVDDED